MAEFIPNESEGSRLSADWRIGVLLAMTKEIEKFEIENYFMFLRRIGIDLGTTNVLVFVPKRGIVINEPSVVAISNIDKKIIAVGVEAREMIGRTPDTIIALRPLKDGVIADYKTTEAMLRYFINKALGGVKLFRPEVMVAVPAGITSTERRAVVDATIAAGAKAAYIIKEPIVAAIGSNIPIGSASGHMIIDVGGGTTEVAVISLGGIVASNSVRIGGNKFDLAITEFIRRKYGLAIGERTAEEIKINIGSALYLEDKMQMEVRGRDMISGLPKIIIVSSDDVTDAIQTELEGIIAAVKVVLHKTPPELSADVLDKGVVMSGGSSLLRNIEKMITQATGVSAYIADEPLFSVAKGTGIALDNLDSYKRSILATK
ncbi:MAG: rod shape-determining protein [Patescibacteria group bacterium]